MLEEAKQLLERGWISEEVQILERLVNSLKSYRFVLPNAIKADIIQSMTLLTQLKDALDEKEVLLARLVKGEAIDACTQTD